MADLFHGSMIISENRCTLFEIVLCCEFLLFSAIRAQREA